MSNRERNRKAAKQTRREMRISDDVSKPKRKNVRQANFTIVARGVNREKPDIHRLMLASLKQQQGARINCESYPHE